MEKKLKEKLWPISLSVIVAVLDQITKALVVKNIPRLSLYGENAIIPVLGKYIRLIHVRNNAIAFSLGHNLSQDIRSILFAFIPLVVIALVYVIYFRNNEFTKLQRWAVCGILGGGIGNLIDRFFRPEGVVDFIDCYFFGIAGMERWPTFNVADIGVVVCGILFVLTFFIQVGKDAKKAKEEKK